MHNMWGSLYGALKGKRMAIIFYLWLTYMVIRFAFLTFDKLYIQNPFITVCSCLAEVFNGRISESIRKFE